MQRLNVELGPRSYPIYIGPGLLRQPELWRPGLGKQVLVVTDEHVAPLYLARVLDALTGLDVAELVLPAGEPSKCAAQWLRVLDLLVARRFERSCTVIALGGGVIGDLAGFAAASYQRGVRFVQMPTTLLAQVDSSVGGKTGINHPGGKNLIGAFHQPAAVIIDTETLHTLPAREVSAGLAEVIKYGVIADVDFLDWLDAHMAALRRLEPTALSHAIAHACAIKARIVGADERESAERALLNFGHTFGHAIESLLGYGEWLHGEAVAAGMTMAADLCVRLGLIDTAQADRLKTLILRSGGPLAPPSGLEPERFLERMRGDKKAQDGRIRLVLLRHLGEAYVSADYPEAELQRFLHDTLT